MAKLATKGKGSPLSVLIFLTLFTLFTAALSVSTPQKTLKQAPTIATIQSIDFDLPSDSAIATVTIPNRTDTHPIDVSNAQYADLVRWANTPNAPLSLMETPEGEWHYSAPNDPLFISLVGLFLITMATLVSAATSRAKRPLARLAFPAFLLLLFWGIHLYYNIFHWQFLLLLAPLTIGWIHFHKVARAQQTPQNTLSWKRPISIFIIALVFEGAGFTLEGFILHQLHTTQTSLQARHEVKLIPHLTKVEHSHSRRTSKTTRHLIASYEKAPDVHHYVHLKSERPLLTVAQRNRYATHFWQLSRGNSVMGSVALHDPDDVYPTFPTPDTALLLNENWHNLHGVYAIHLLAIPFMLVGMNLLMLALFEGLALRNPLHRALPPSQPSPKDWLKTAQWSLLPLGLFAAYQWLTLYGRLPKIPPISALFSCLPILITLGIIVIRKRQCTRSTDIR
jgi:hypothetical protein